MNKYTNTSIQMCVFKRKKSHEYLQTQWKCSTVSQIRIIHCSGKVMQLLGASCGSASLSLSLSHVSRPLPLNKSSVSHILSLIHPLARLFRFVAKILWQIQAHKRANYTNAPSISTSKQLQTVQSEPVKNFLKPNRHFLQHFRAGGSVFFPPLFWVWCGLAKWRRRRESWNKRGC